MEDSILLFPHRQCSLVQTGKARNGTLRPGQGRASGSSQLRSGTSQAPEPVALPLEALLPVTSWGSETGPRSAHTCS